MQYFVFSILVQYGHFFLSLLSFAIFLIVFLRKILPKIKQMVQKDREEKQILICNIENNIEKLDTKNANLIEEYEQKQNKIDEFQSSLDEEKKKLESKKNTNCYVSKTTE